MSDATPSPAPARPPAGTWVVAGMLALAVALAVFGIWYQHGQTRRCLGFYGSVHARRIQAAPRVELWPLAATGETAPVVPVRRIDISKARGVVHMRRGLVEDANFAWDDGAAIDGLPPAFALAFFDDAVAREPATLLVVRLDDRGGSIEVDGQPGTVALGRIESGLRTWLAEAAAGETAPEPAGGRRPRTPGT